MTTDATAAKNAFRPWQDLRWITGGVVALFLGWVGWNLFGPEPAIVVSRETTFLAEPLAADGLPDYAAAMLAFYGPAPKPEENAAAAILEICWPLGIDAADLPEVCRAIGIPNEPPTEPLREPSADASAKITTDMYGESHSRPWTSEEFPGIAAWVERNGPAIDRIVEAAERPKYWLPSPSLLRSGPQMLLSMLLPDLQELRQVSRMLLCRGLWHIGEGRYAEAWRDIRAIYRLGRLLAKSDGESAILVARLVAIAMTASADLATTRHLLGSADIPADVVAVIRRDLDEVGPPPAEFDAGLGERLFGIDTVVWLARREPGGRAARMRIMGGIGIGGSGWSPMAAVMATSLDWNIVLARMNASYDDLDAAWRLPAFAARQLAAQRHAAECTSRTAAPYRNPWTILGHLLLLATNRGHRSATIGDSMVQLLVPALAAFHDATTRSRAAFELSRTSAALAAWHADRPSGSPPYPDRLDELVPGYLAAVPIDPYSDQPLVYLRRGDGYLLLSVGKNAVDDGGDDFSGDIVDGEWQEPARDVDYDRSDIVVRMPGPPRKPRADERPK